MRLSEIIINNKVFKPNCLFVCLLYSFCTTVGAQQWNHLGPGLNNVGYPSIAIADTNVYVGGYFQDAGGNPEADYIARWDGCQWNALGNGVNGAVFCIAISGEDVYIGGNFTQPFPFVARWNGTQWNAVGDMPEGP